MRKLATIVTVGFLSVTWGLADNPNKQKQHDDVFHLRPPE